jgi:uncharacterized protein (DUF433 family)
LEGGEARIIAGLGSRKRKHLAISQNDEIVLFPVKAGLPIEIDPEIMSGTPVFTGTRVPVGTLFDYLMKGSSLDEFLDCFPTVKREDALTLLDHYKHEALAVA